MRLQRGEVAHHPGRSSPPTSRDPDPATTVARRPSSRCPGELAPGDTLRLQLHRRRRRAPARPGRRLPGAAQRQRHRSTATSGGSASCPPTCVQQPAVPAGPHRGRLAVAADRAHPPRRRPATSSTTAWPPRSPPAAGSTARSRSSSGCRAAPPPGGTQTVPGRPGRRSRSTPRWSRSSSSWPPARTRSPASTGAGHGTDAAAAFLDRLAAVAAVHPVVALPYGDVDADALDGRRAVRRRDPQPARQPRGHGAGPGPGGVGARPRPPRRRPAARRRRGTAGAGRRADPRRRPGRRARAPTSPGPPDGTVRARDAWPRCRPAAIDRVVLEQRRAHRRRHGGRAVAAAAPPPTRTVPDAAGRRRRRWWPTRRSARIVGAAEQTPGGGADGRAALPGRAGRAHRCRRRAGHASRPCWSPRRGTCDAGPEGAGAMMADTAGLPWLRASALDELFAGPSAAGRRPGRPRDAGPASTPPGWPTSRRPWPLRDDLAGAVVGDAGRRAARPTTPRSPGPPRSRGAATPRASAPRARGLRTALERLREPGDAAGPGRRHLQPGLQRRPAGAHRAQRPARSPSRSCSTLHDPRHPRPVDLRHRRPDARPRASARRCRCPPRCASPAGSR